ncbi:MAG TPA: hypothetical protein VFM97_03695 [Gammaproteobacteria bacterium]|nr:hypothetical protein [Gammaproteobacteria bacterium]
MPQALPPSSNPFARALTLFVAAIAVGVSLLFGFVAFLILAGMALILVAIVAARVWWLQHKIRRHMAHKEPQGDFIEGDFEVEEQRDKTRHG